jgi:tetratricopeptide (TPR) repeat protein
MRRISLTQICSISIASVFLPLFVFPHLTVEAQPNGHVSIKPVSKSPNQSQRYAFITGVGEHQNQEQGSANKEQESWNSLQNSTNIAAFQEYLKQYPNGSYVEMARNQIRQLKATAEELERKGLESYRAWPGFKSRMNNVTPEYQKAMDLFREAVKIDSKNAKTHARLGYILAYILIGSDGEFGGWKTPEQTPEGRSRFEEAEAELKESLQIEPNHIKRLEALAHVLAVLGKYEEEKTIYLRLQDLEPTKTLWYTDFAFTLDRQGNPSEAETKFKEIIGMFPRDAWPHAAYGLYLKSKGRLTEAETEMRAAISLATSNSEKQRYQGFLNLVTNKQ